MASKYSKKCSNSLVMEVMQIRTTLRFHLSPVRMALFKGNIKTTNTGEDAVKQEAIYTLCECVCLCVCVCVCVCKITFS
jgi:hypothetical protein